MIFSWFKWFVTHRKKLEEVDFVDEEFQHKKINNKDFYYADYGILQKIFQKNKCMQLRQSGLSGVRHYGDLTTLN